MATNPNYYDLLGVRSSASLEEMHAAYHAAIRHYHPDVNKAPNAEQITAMLNQAWDTLRDPTARARYDREIAPRQAPPRPPQPQTSPWSGAYGQGQQWSGGYSRGRQWTPPNPEQRQQWSNQYWQYRTTATARPDLVGAMVGRIVSRTVRLITVVGIGIVGIAMFTHLIPYLFPMIIGFFILRQVAGRR